MVVMILASPHYGNAHSRGGARGFKPEPMMRPVGRVGAVAAGDREGLAADPAPGLTARWLVLLGLALLGPGFTDW